MSNNKISRENYAKLYGPTTGDRIRLGDTNLKLRIEKDFTVYGNEMVFGLGGSIKDGQGQSSVYSTNDVDLVITNVVIIDHNQIIKADIGIKNGLITAIGKSGNPRTMPGVDIVIGPGTEVYNGANLIATPGGIDARSHFINPKQIYNALYSGITTMIGGGVGLATGSIAAGTTSGPECIKQMLQSADDFPVNMGFVAKGSSSQFDGLSEQISAGAMGLAIHESWGASPLAIDNCLDVADNYDVQVSLQIDNRNEEGTVEDAIRAFKGRTLQVELLGAFSPKLAGLNNTLPISTADPQLYSEDGIDSVKDLLYTLQQLNPELDPNLDLYLADLFTQPETMSAIDILHDQGVISMIGSGMGNPGEIIRNVWRMAGEMKVRLGLLPGDDYDSDNGRIKRYVAKYTINPAITMGINSYVGELSVGKLADIILWKPAFFGVKPELIIKGGNAVAGVIGDAGSASPIAQPLTYGSLFSTIGKDNVGFTFVSQASIKEGNIDRYSLRKKVAPVSKTRTLSKAEMKHNSSEPNIEIDSETYQVYSDGTALKHESIEIAVLSQRYFLF